MQFLFPAFLAALAAIAIPIIIHLFHFRRFKKVYFTNVKFLKEIKEETSARSKLRNLLVLLMRMLAIAALVLAFAQPFIPVADSDVQKGTKAVSVFLDNSFSMSALSQEVPLLELAKQRARDIVSAHSVEDKFQILTNDFEGRHQRLLSQEDALTYIDEVKISPAVKSLSTVITRQQQALATGTIDNTASYIISDFQQNITDLANYQDTSLTVHLVPLSSIQEKNISIDSAWFEAPIQMIGQTNPLLVKVSNRTDEAVNNIRLSLRYDGQVKPIGTLSIPANRSLIDTVNISILKTGWHRAELNITDYPVQFDDNYYFAYYIPTSIKVLSIQDNIPNPFLNAAFRGMTNFELDNQRSNSLNYADFSNYQFIILNELNSISSGLSFELNQYVNNGGNLLILPNRNANIDSYRAFFQTFPANEYVSFEENEQSIGRINTEEFIFKDVFENKRANLTLPVIQGHFKMTQLGSRGAEALMTYRNGQTALAKYQIGSGNLYVSTAPLDVKWNNLARNGEIFIPMLYKMAIATAKQPQIAYTIGKNEVLESKHQLTSDDLVYKLKGQAEEFIPEQRIIGSKVVLGVNNQIKKAGYYNLFLNPESTLSQYAYNYDRKESALDYYNEEDLAKFDNPKLQIITANLSANFEQLIGERSQGIVLWRWCLIIALIFLAIETLLLRFWKA